MRIELQRQLFERYPRLFRQPGQRLVSDEGEEPYLKDDAGPLDFYGIECGDGWLEIIDRLCGLCESEIRSMQLRRIPREVWPRCGQIKEKFGSLRMYVDGPLSESTRAAIDAAEQESARICEICGAPGELQPENNYLLTLCDVCRATRNNADSAAEWAEHDAHIAAVRELLAARPK